MNVVRIGSGAGYAGDRIEPATRLAADPDLDYLVFECLAERTIADAQRRKLRDESKGYSPLLERRLEEVLPKCAEHETTILSNMGAANPTRARGRAAAVATELGVTGLDVASVTGSDVTGKFDEFAEQTFEGEPTRRYEADCVSANAYMGVDGVLTALEQGADVILTGRIADPSLFLAPMVHEFGWESEEDLQSLGQGTACAHLLECAGQVTGGYFADPGYKEVDDLATLGFPIGEVSADGDVVLTKLPNTGGEVTTRTCKEQILYEVHDPSAYLTPDVVADFGSVSFEAIAADRVAVSGADADPKPDTLKVSIGYRDAFLGEGLISYGGPGAEARARLAGDIVRERLQSNARIDDLRVDVIGVDSLHGSRGEDRSEPYEVRLRVAGKGRTRDDATEIGREVQRLYTNGPAGGGGASMRTNEVIGIASTLIDREHVTPKVEIEEV